MSTRIGFLLMFSFFLSMLVHADWLQLQGNAQRSGNVPGEVLKGSLGLMAAIPLTDGVQAAPVVADGAVYVLDGSGVVPRPKHRVFRGPKVHFSGFSGGYPLFEPFWTAK